MPITSKEIYHDLVTTVCLIWKDNNADKYFTKATEGYNFFARLVNHARLVYIVHRPPDLIKSTGLVNNARLVDILQRSSDLIKSKRFVNLASMVNIPQRL